MGEERARYLLDPEVRREVEKRMTDAAGPTIKETLDLFDISAQREADKWLKTANPDMHTAVNAMIKSHNYSVERVMNRFKWIYGDDSSKRLRVQVELAAKWAMRERYS